MTISKKHKTLIATFLISLLTALYPATALAAIRQITSNPSNQTSPSIFENTIVYEDDRGGNSDIYKLDLSASNYEELIVGSSSYEQNPSIYQNKIVYENWNILIGSDIFLYDLIAKGSTPVANNSVDEISPAIYQNKIVWEDYRNMSGYSDIYSLDSVLGEQPVTDVNDSVDQYNPAIYGNRVVWEEYDETYGDWDIYLYDPSVDPVAQLITPDLNDQFSPAIYGDKVVWLEDDGSGLNDNEVILYNLSTGARQQITDDSIDQLSPAIYGDKIVWSQDQGGHNHIFLYEPDPYVPPTDGGGQNPPPTDGNNQNPPPVSTSPSPGSSPTVPTMPTTPAKTILSTLLNLSAKPKAVKAGKFALIKGQLKDANGRPIANKVVNVKANGRVIKTLKTSVSGIFSFKHKPKKTAKYQAVFAGDTDYATTSSKTVKVIVKKVKRKR